MERLSLLAINIVEYLLCFRCWMISFDVVVHPCDEMILEGTFN
jgi:hypothetical protein